MTEPTVEGPIAPGRVVRLPNGSVGEVATVDGDGMAAVYDRDEDQEWVVPAEQLAEWDREAQRDWLDR